MHRMRARAKRACCRRTIAGVVLDGVNVAARSCVRPLRHLLVPTDFGPAADAALEHALEVAVALEAKLTLLHVAWVAPATSTACAEDFSFPSGELASKANALLERLAARARARHVAVETLIVGGEVWEMILAAAQDRSVDMIVMGTHGRTGVPRFLVGSVAERVVRLAALPVLVVPASR